MKLPIGDKLIVTNIKREYALVILQCLTMSIYYCFLNSAFQDRFILLSLNVLQICSRRTIFKTDLVTVTNLNPQHGSIHASHFSYPPFWYPNIQYSTIDWAVQKLVRLRFSTAREYNCTQIERKKGSTYITRGISFPITWNQQAIVTEICFNLIESI